LAAVEEQEPTEVLLGAVDRLVEQGDVVAVEAVLLGGDGDAENAVAEIPGLAAAVLDDRRAALAHRPEGGGARIELSLHLLAGGEVEDRLAVVEAVGTLVAHALDGGGKLDAFLLHALDRFDET